MGGRTEVGEGGCFFPHGARGGLREAKIFSRREREGSGG